MSAFKDLTGLKFNFLTAVRFSQMRNSRAYWIWKCECWLELELSGAIVTRKAKPQKSCKKCYDKRRLLHGMTNTKEFFAWRGILSRCNNKADEAYHNYGGRGITVCKRWLQFNNFFYDMGYAPSKKHSIDRVDNNKGYSKSNCRWATIQEQHRNKRTTRIIEYNGEKMCLKDWANKLGVNYYALMNRLNRGMDVITAFTKPIKSKNGFQSSYNIK